MAVGGGIDAHGSVDAAIARGDWASALDALRAAEAERDLRPDELEQLARAAYGSGELEAAITAWERLHADRVAAGDHLAAAGAATSVAMYLMMDTGLMAPVRGWVARAQRLLEGQPEAPVHAWLAMVRAYERLMSGDMEGAGHWADRAVEVGTRQAAPAPAAIGRVAAARVLIFGGRVDEGLAQLDETAVAVMSGEIEPLVIGMVYCELICAMQGLAQYDRAEEWTDAMERWRHGSAVGGINGRCRVHRAEILRLRGSCEEAEEEALHACRELRPWMRREFGWPLTELGTIRLRRGDLAGAQEAFLAAHEHGWDPQPGLALLRLAQGETAEATLLIDDALTRPLNIPSKERPPQGGLRRAPLLEARVEICLAAGDVPTARGAADELGRIAETFGSRALAASAALARGRVALATGAARAAVRACAEAVAGWSEVAAPYETAVARTVLAQAQCADGNERAASLELRAAREAFERIGARRRAQEAARAGAALGGPPPPGPTGPAAPAPVAAGADGIDAAEPASNVFRLEGDTRSIVFDGVAVLLRDLKGMRYLARLLGEPGREFHVLDLVVAEEGAGRTAGPAAGAAAAEAGLSTRRDGDAGKVLDAQATAAYRRRLRDIEEDIEEATRFGDPERVALAEADRDYLVAELSAAVGLGGRRRRVGSTSERARASVTRAVRYALDRITDHHPELGAHLARTVHTGTYCSYTPDPRLAPTWHL